MYPHLGMQSIVSKTPPIFYFVYYFFDRKNAQPQVVVVRVSPLKNIFLNRPSLPSVSFFNFFY